MRDASHCKVHPHATGAKGGNQDMNRTKVTQYKIASGRRFSLACRSGLLLQEGTTADCTQACMLIEGLTAEYLLADKGYDSNDIIDQAIVQGIKPVIPSKRNRLLARTYDKDLYRLRHLVENAFLHLKRWRGIATRYAKNTASFLAAVQIRCIAL